MRRLAGLRSLLKAHLDPHLRARRPNLKRKTPLNPMRSQQMNGKEEDARAQKVLMNCLRDEASPTPAGMAQQLRIKRTSRANHYPIGKNAVVVAGTTPTGD